MISYHGIQIEPIIRDLEKVVREKKHEEDDYELQAIVDKLREIAKNLTEKAKTEEGVPPPPPGPGKSIFRVTSNLRKVANFLKRFQKIAATQIKEIQKFLDSMDDIDYGYVDKEGKHYSEIDPKEFYEKYQLQSPDELRKSKRGVCWGQVEYEREWFNEHNIPFKTYYIQMDNPERASHTFLVFNLNKQWYIFEHSDFENRGIHKVENPNDAIQKASEQLKKENPEYNIDYCVEYDQPEYNIGCDEFLDHVSKQLKISTQLHKIAKGIVRDEILEFLKKRYPVYPSYKLGTFVEDLEKLIKEGYIINFDVYSGGAPVAYLRKDEDYPWGVFSVESSTLDKYAVRKQKKAVDGMREILKKNGWKRNPDLIIEESLQTFIETYTKGSGEIKLRFRPLYVEIGFKTAKHPSGIIRTPEFLIERTLLHYDSSKDLQDFKKAVEEFEKVEEAIHQEAIEVAKTHCDEAQLQKGPFVHYTNNLDTTMQILKGDIPAESLNVHTELDLPAFCVTCAPKLQSYEDRGFKIHLRPRKPLKVFNPKGGPELYKSLQNIIETRSLEIFEEGPYPLLKKENFDAIYVPYGGYTGRLRKRDEQKGGIEEEFEVTILAPTALKVEKVEQRVEGEYQDITEKVKKEYSEVF